MVNNTTWNKDSKKVSKIIFNNKKESSKIKAKPYQKITFKMG
jgi:hypothetical protein